jgi:hypothetical protein
VNPQTGRVDVLRQEVADLTVMASGAYEPEEGSAEMEFWYDVSAYGFGHATGVTFTHTLPEGATLVSVETSQGTVDTSQPGKVVVHLGTLRALEDDDYTSEDYYAEIRIRVIPGPGGSLEDHYEARADQPDPNPSDNVPPVEQPTPTPWPGELDGTTFIDTLPGGNFYRKNFVIVEWVPDAATPTGSPAGQPASAAASRAAWTAVEQDLPGHVAQSQFSWERNARSTGEALPGLTEDDEDSEPLLAPNSGALA